MIQGSCLCGNVKFEFDEGHIVLFNYCHCTRCQKFSGTAHTSQLQVQASSYRWLQGTNLITYYQSSPAIKRAFCQTCGSRLPGSQDWKNGVVAIPAGLLDADPGVRPEIQIHTESIAPWHALDQSLACIPDQGSNGFWKKFMKEKNSGD